MKFVKRYMKPCAALILFTLFLKLVSAALDLMIPRILATMIDEIAPSASAGRILNAGIAMIVMAAVAAFQCKREHTVGGDSQKDYQAAPPGSVCKDHASVSEPD